MLHFREFYYIQMEKYARQSIAEGLAADKVEITTDSELYKILNLHYNRNNQIEVSSTPPQQFVPVSAVEITTLASYLELYHICLNAI